MIDYIILVMKYYINYIINVPFHKRRMFTRLRISAHNLAIEKGRHMALPKKPDIKCNFCGHVKTECTCNRFKYNRLCHYCNVVEDEAHFLLKCSIYNQVRTEFFTKISDFTTLDLTHDDDSQCFTILMHNLYVDPEL